MPSFARTYRYLSLLLVGLLGLLSSARAQELCPEALAKGLLSTEGDWLFSETELQHQFIFDTSPDILPYVKALAEAFGDNGLNPMLALLPSRGMVYGDGLSAYEASASRDAYQAFRNTLNRQGFLTPDLLYLFEAARQQEQQLFFKADTLWLPEAARLSAQELSNVLEQYSSYAALAKTKFETAEDGKESYKGLLSRQIEQACGQTQKEESFSRFVTRAVEEKTIAEEATFTQQKRPDIILLSTQTRDQLMNFSGFLAQYSGLQVNAIKRFEGSILSPLASFFSSDAYQLEGYRPSFVIWTFDINQTIQEGNYFSAAEPLSYRQLIPAAYGQCEAQSMLMAEGREGYVQLSNEANLEIAGSNYYLVVASDAIVTGLEVVIHYQNGQKEELELSQMAYDSSRYFLEFSDFIDGKVDRVEVRSSEEADLKAHICNNGKTQARQYERTTQALLKVDAPFGVAENARSAPAEAAFQEAPEAVTVVVTPAVSVTKLEEPGAKAEPSSAEATAFSPEIIESTQTWAVIPPLGESHTSRVGQAEVLPGLSAPPPDSLPPVNLNETNLMLITTPQMLPLEGKATTENKDFRWALGPSTRINFNSDKLQSLEVTMDFFNPIEGQGLEVSFNGSTVQNLGLLHQGTHMKLSFYVKAIPGLNHLTLNYKDWNGKETIFAPDDLRPIALLFRELELRERP